MGVEQVVVRRAKRGSKSRHVKEISRTPISPVREEDIDLDSLPSDRFDVLVYENAIVIVSLKRIHISDGKYPQEILAPADVRNDLTKSGAVRSSSKLIGSLAATMASSAYSYYSYS